MATTIKIISFTAFSLLICSELLSADLANQQDVYVVIFATHDGVTGHAGIAIDQYRVIIRDCRTCPDGVRKDTVKTGRLLYFDLWPEEDHFDKELVLQEVASQYYRLPNSSSEAPITVFSLSQKGLPHRGGRTCDALLKLESTPAQDWGVIRFLDNMIEENRSFHALNFNCSDLVERALEYHLKVELQADERILWSTVTTPNRLYLTLTARPEVKILKNPGDLVNGSFWKERVLDRKN